jgi:hypothetical protein
VSRAPPDAIILAHEEAATGSGRTAPARARKTG